MLFACPGYTDIHKYTVDQGEERIISGELRPDDISIGCDTGTGRIKE